MYFINFFKPNSNFIFDTFNYLPKNHNSLDNITNSTNSSFSKSYLSTEALILTHSLGKVTYNLSKLNDSKSFKTFFESLSKNTKINHEFSLLNILDFGFSENCVFKNSQIITGVNTYKPKFDFDSKPVTLSLSNLNTLQNYKVTQSLSNFNIYSNLNYSKQLRWATKNSLLSNTSTSDLFYFTQSKNIIGNTLYNSLNTSQNI
jgi:hypothetical protein